MAKCEFETKAKEVAYILGLEHDQVYVNNVVMSVNDAKNLTELIKTDPEATLEVTIQ